MKVYSEHSPKSRPGETALTADGLRWALDVIERFDARDADEEAP